MTISKCFDGLSNNGYLITPCDGKAPILKAWQSKTENGESWKTRYADNNVGILLGSNLAAVDIDVSDQLVNDLIVGMASGFLGEAPLRFGNKPKCLFLYKVDAAISKMFLQFDYEGTKQKIEILGDGQQFIGFGIHPDTKLPYEWLNEVSPLTTSVNDLTVISKSTLVSFLKVVQKNLQELGATNFKSNFREEKKDEGFFSEDEDMFEDIVAELSDEEIEEYRQKLNEIDPDCEYDEWIKHGMALHSLNCDKLFFVWEEWSQKGSKYEKGVCKKHWKTFSSKGNGNAVTIASLEFASKKIRSGKIEKTLLEKIDDADVQYLKEGLADEIKKTSDLSEFAFEEVCVEWKKRYTKLTGRAIAINIVRDMLKPFENVSEVTKPNWAKGWVWVNEDSVHFNLASSKTLTLQNFDLNFWHYIEEDDNGHKMQPTAFLSKFGNLTIKDRIMYMPQLGREFQIGSEECVNSFSKKSLPPVAENYTEDGLITIKMVEDHIRHLCSQREEVIKALMDWMAYTIQNMGKKINFAPLIQGIEGDGKSMLTTIMACSLGHENIFSAQPTIFHDNFNGFAEGSCLVAIEELRMVGHNRYDVLDRVKPLITNDNISIRKPYKGHYMIPNVTNYMAFTNYKDALPLSDTDRRWLIIFTEWANAQDMKEIIGVDDLAKYFYEIHKRIEIHAPQINKFFREYPISEDFNPKAPAPMTHEKEVMAKMSRSEFSEFVNDLILQGGIGFDKKVVSTRMLKNAISANSFDENFEYGDKQITSILMAMGYSKFTKMVRWQNNRHHVWVKKNSNISVEAVKDLLEETCHTENLDDF